MKRIKTVSIFILLILTTISTNAQWTLGTDVYSQYIWRGVKYGSGPAVLSIILNKIKAVGNTQINAAAIPSS